MHLWKGYEVKRPTAFQFGPSIFQLSIKALTTKTKMVGKPTILFFIVEFIVAGVLCIPTTDSADFEEFFKSPFTALTTITRLLHATER